MAREKTYKGISFSEQDEEVDEEMLDNFIEGLVKVGYIIDNGDDTYEINVARLEHDSISGLEIDVDDDGNFLDARITERKH